MRTGRKKRRSRNSAYGKVKRDRNLPLKVSFCIFLCAVLALIVFVVRIAAVYMAELPEIPLANVRLEGAGGLDYAELLAKAGITRKTDLMSMDVKGVKDDLIAAEPYIKNAVVEKNLFSGALDIRIQLRTPAALLSDNGLWAIDREAVVIGSIEKIRFKDLPVITGLDVGVPTPGSIILSDKLAGAYSVLDSARGAGIGNVISEINISDPRSIIVFMEISGKSVQTRFNVDTFAGRMEEAAMLLASFREEGKEVEYIDLRFPNRPPIVKFRR